MLSRLGLWVDSILVVVPSSCPFLSPKSVWDVFGETECSSSGARLSGHSALLSGQGCALASPKFSFPPVSSHSFARCGEHPRPTVSWEVVDHTSFRLPPASWLCRGCPQRLRKVWPMGGGRARRPLRSQEMERFGIAPLYLSATISAGSSERAGGYGPTLA